MMEYTKIHEVMSRRATSVRSAGGKADICVMFDGPSVEDGLEIYGEEYVKRITPLLTRDEKVREFFGTRYISVPPHRSNTFIKLLSEYWSVALVSLNGSKYYCVCTVPGRGMPAPAPTEDIDEDAELAEMLGLTPEKDDEDWL